MNDIYKTHEENNIYQIETVREAVPMNVLLTFCNGVDTRAHVFHMCDVNMCITLSVAGQMAAWILDIRVYFMLGDLQKL